MLREVDHFYLDKEEPVKSCLLALREIILGLDPEVTAAWKYRMPFFCYRGKGFCYLWTDKKTKEPYIGVIDGNKIEHASLEQGNRSRMKIMRIHPTQDLPLETIESILGQSLDFRRKD